MVNKKIKALVDLFCGKKLRKLIFHNWQKISSDSFKARKFEILISLFYGKSFSWITLSEHEDIRLHNLSEKRRICKIYKTKA